jgi:hypothetical protein
VGSGIDEAVDDRGHAGRDEPVELAGTEPEPDPPSQPRDRRSIVHAAHYGLVV